MDIAVLFPFLLETCLTKGSLQQRLIFVEHLLCVMYGEFNDFFVVDRSGVYHGAEFCASIPQFLLLSTHSLFC